MTRLDSATTTLIIDDGIVGLPRVAYWGKRLQSDISQAMLAADRSRALPQGGLDDDVALSLLPEAGAGFMGHPGIAGSRGGYEWLTRFETDAIEKQCNTLVIIARDDVAALGLTIELTLDDECGVLTSAVELVNNGDAPYTVDWLAALACPLPARVDELLTFEGRWSREFQTRRQSWPDQALTGDNRTGRTSHHSFPGLIAGTAHFGEQAGEVFGFHLGWSGNHRWLAERLRDGRRQVQLGELLLPGEIVLEPGARYKTPVAYAAWSGTGLSGMANAWHRFVRRRILPSATQTPRPVHANTWEAFYFDHQPARLMAFADRAAALGCERFVLDDGWFRGRDDDRRALGDWTVDAGKYPDGLAPLAQHVNALGMQFGLWVEPEMVNPNSDLFRAHPDWILATPGYRQPIGRHQYVLDLARPEVRAYLFEHLDALLSNLPIAYLKWDMNRDLTQPGHAGRPAVHAQTRAVYELIDRIRTAHPTLEIESCASGGARADFGILQRTDRVWTSDCNDGIERQSIHDGFRLFFPPEIMGAHIGPNASHTTGRVIEFDFQGATALFGHFGLELDVTALNEQEADDIAAWIRVYKDWRAHLHGGHPVRLDVDESGVIAHGIITPDGNRALYAYARLASARDPVPPPLRLTGLAPDRHYRVRLLDHPRRKDFGMRTMPDALNENGHTFTGEWLERCGIQIPIVAPQQALLIAADAVH
ncbi:alpha-galactosidase [Salinisphaera sp. SWV1]|uniref:alpha-galactosidase n=1 Tax=Salinisphaera sp. SWV1 TaxID=3454139 RepID=UPI003F85F9DD